MIVLAAVATALCLSCTDRNPTAAAAGARLDEAPASPALVEGCATLLVRISGRDDATVRSDTSSRCGPVVPVVVGAAVFDRAHGTLRLPLALRNTGQRKVRAPAELYAWEDSATVTDPPGLAQNRHEPAYVQLTGADSLIATDAAEHAGALVWKYASALAAVDSPQTLAAGKTSGVRWLELKVHDGVHAFRLVLHASARRASPPIPMTVPEDQWPRSLDAHTVRCAAIMAGLCTYDVIDLWFKPGATQEQLDEAVDAVDGEMVGGTRAAGVYYIQIPSDGTLEPMKAALDRIRRLPQVEDAFPHNMTPVSLDYLHPTDGPHWDRWDVAPGRASDNRWGHEAVALPLAWGCTSGDVGAPVAFVDHGFFPPADVTPDISPLSSGVGVFSNLADASPGDANEHGTLSSSIVAAQGNNRQGITGVLWASGTRLYEIALDSLGRVDTTAGGVPNLVPRRVTLALAKAGRDGAGVVNLSIGTGWGSIRHPGYNPARETHKDSIDANRGYVQSAGRYVRRMVDTLAALNAQTLLVFSAGNDSTDTQWDVCLGRRLVSQRDLRRGRHADRPREPAVLSRVVLQQRIGGTNRRARCTGARAGPLGP